MIGLKEIFPANTLEQWLDRLKKDLKSEDLHELNRIDSIEEIEVNSYGHKDLVDILPLSPGQFPYTRGLTIQSNSWKNAFYILVKDCKESNEKALEVLMKGVDALVFELTETSQDLDLLIKSIELPYIHMTFIPRNLEQLRWILNGPGKTSKSTISISIDLVEKEIFRNEFRTIAEQIKEHQLPIFLADGFKIQQCGASISQELAYLMACGNDYLQRLLNHGLTIDEAAACIHFRVGIGSGYFEEIAKIRALRLLWSNVVKQYDPIHSCSYNCRITAQTGSMNKSAKDPNTNLLRQTTEAMSATVGGIDQLVVLPFDFDTTKGSSTLSERMAINLSLILREESYLHAVIDPAGGSYTIEDLTDKLAEKAWLLFQDMDSEGGIIAPVCREKFIRQVKEKAVERMELVKNKTKTLIGVNKFPNPADEENSFENYGSYLGLTMINFERDI
jgi:methylmalonyl-CoA mutase